MKIEREDIFGPVRSLVEWDDQPADLDSTTESFARAHPTAMTEPQGPVCICPDADMQERGHSGFPALPDPAKFSPPAASCALPQTLQRIAELTRCEVHAPALVDVITQVRQACLPGHGRAHRVHRLPAPALLRPDACDL